NSADGSTSVPDIYGNTWTAFGNANVQSASPWKSGEKYFVFDGSGDYLKTTGMDFTGNSFTVHLRVNFNDVNTEQVFVRGVAAYSFQLEIYQGKLHFSNSSNGFSWDIASTSPGSATLSANQWYDIEVSYSSTAGYKIYLNGTLDSSF